MKLNKPNFWDYKKPNFLAYILLPLTFPILIRNFFAKSFSKKKWPKLLTIIIPRHVERCNQIVESLEKYELKIHKHSSKKTINKKVDIYLVDTYGETNLFFSFNKIVFVGGSIIKHGGQNPLEPARYGNSVLHGPNVDNFKEIYELLKKFGISKKVNSIKSLTDGVDKLIKHIIRWLDHNIDEAHTIIAEDSYDLKDKIELYLEGVDEFG